MDLPIELPVTPMLAKAVTSVPAQDSVPGGYAYEPKWDGFRCIVLRDGDEIELASRGLKPLTRYFPEVIAYLRDLIPTKCAIDAEIVVRAGVAGAARLDWESLSQRIHPAESRINMLSQQTPAELICFDLLALGEESYLDRPYWGRREGLEGALADLDASDPVHLTRITTEHALAEEWFEKFEGAGLDGVIAKARESVYSPGKRTMLKIKHSRTAEAVAIGYRVHKSGQGVGSLLLGMYAEHGQLIPVGGIGAFTNATRLALIDELAPLVMRDDDGETVQAQTDRSRFSASKDVSFVPLRPERVVEVKFDQLEGHRFRHAATFLRWRPDRDPQSALLDQVDRAPAYDLNDVLTS